MAELTPQERLQPSLLDRLTDDEPGQRQESRDKRVLGLRQLRESVRRDLAWLFNTTNLDAVQDLDNFPEVAESVLNFGLPEMSGHVVATSLSLDLERQVRQALLAFEPRIQASSLDVHVTANDEDMSHNALTFEIVGELWAQPVPEQLYLKTEMDLDLGVVSVTEGSGRG